MKPQLSIGTLKDSFLAFPCEDWRRAIYDLLAPNAILKDDILVGIPDKLIDRIRKEGSKEMKEYVKSLGIILEEDKNAFVKEFESPAIIKEISSKFFGNAYIFSIGRTITDAIKRPDLNGRSFYLAHTLEVILHKVDEGKGGTIIEIVKK